MTFPSLQQRWQRQPQRGEVIGVSASVLGDMVGFVIAELLPDFKAEIISLFVDPNHRQKGVATRMLAFLEREIFGNPFRATLNPLASDRGAVHPNLRKIEVKALSAKAFGS